MPDKMQNEYYPDSFTSPGETLLETLETRGMSQAELARRLGCSVKLVNEIIQAQTVITPEIAGQLEQALRVPASFWLNMEQYYREFLARPVKEQCLMEWAE
jgi:addiction module HigA family antidote